MSFSLNTVTNKSLSPLESSPTSVIKKNQQENADAMTVEFAELLQGGKLSLQKEIITKDEKKFFSKLFPQAVSAIQSYTSYSPTGTRKPVALGTIIDVKG